MTPDHSPLPPEGATQSAYLRLRVAPEAINAAILDHPEFATFKAQVTHRFEAWRTTAAAQFKAFDKDGRPKALLETVSESLLAAFREALLLDAYDVYQHLMDYVEATLLDDAYRIAEEGWTEAAKPRLIVEDKARKTKVRPDFAVGRKKYQAELIPPARIIARYFAADQAAIDALEAALATLEQQLEEIAEEQGGEGGLLEDAKNDKDKLTKASVAARMKEIRTDRDAAEERKALQGYLALGEQEAETAAKLKAAQDGLMEKVLAKYSTLTEDEVKVLVVDDKWLATVSTAVQGELDCVSQALTDRVDQLAVRYAVPMPKMTEDLAALAHKVDAHLLRMSS
jgi:type I restriction enzyme M protein